MRGVCGSLSECAAAGVPALAGHREALRRGPGPLRLGDPVRYCRRLHLHRWTRHNVGAGAKETHTRTCDEAVYELACFSSSSSQVAFFLFLSLSVYTVLPLSLAWALMVGIGTSVSHIVIISVYVPVTSPETPELVEQVKMVCV